LHGLNTRRHAKVDEGIHMPRFFGGNVVFHLKALHLTGEGGCKGAGVKFGDSRNAGLTGQ
jgi:hypothetical protein